MSEVLAPLELTPKERELLGIIQDPVRFCEKILQDKPWWSAQIEIARAVEKPDARVAINGCHSSSKTYTMAQQVLWFVTRYPDGIVITTAPTDRQVKDIMWGELTPDRSN